jgi:hypothetical protein
VGSASVVNAGVLDPPVTGEPVVGFVIRGRARKLANLRVRPRVIVGGTADDWAGVDTEMGAERHTAALVRPARIYSNPG